MLFGFDLMDLAIEVGLIGGAAYMGKKYGEKEAYRNIEEKMRDAEINKLKEEIERLKRK
jgi:hypothetical protein